MQSRRSFLATALSTAAVPVAAWADVGNPTHLSAARDPSGDYALYGLRRDGSLAFRQPLPDRGHAAAAHSTLPEAVAFARRPGRFALVLNCQTGNIIRQLNAPHGTHFYGHGVFSLDGNFLFTTENQIETGQGQIGVWSRTSGYDRIDSFPSQGIGPHEIIRLPGSSTLVVANGGIHTHPDRGRAKLNLDTMRPNLALLDETGRLLDLAQIPQALHQNSLRHIAATDDGTVACALQWQGDAFDAPSLLAIYHPEHGLTFAPMADAVRRRMKAYAGSVAILENGGGIALTSPRGGTLELFDKQGQATARASHADICGVAAAEGGGMATDGTGRVYRISKGQTFQIARHDLAFDNHLVRIHAA